MSAKPSLVYVRWDDAIHPEQEWVHTSDVKREPCMLVETVGWLVHRSERSVHVAVSISDRDDENPVYAGVMVIPAGCVESITPLPLPAAPAKKRK